MSTSSNEPTSIGRCARGDATTWRCPVCAVEVIHEYGPGRKRVYCSNACKMRAYRWRRREGVRLRATPWTPAQRSEHHKAHAVRPATDFVGGRADALGREVAVCGAFARRIHLEPRTHHEFTPGKPRSCRSCTQLIGADPDWARLYPPGRIEYRAGRWDWAPNPVEQRRLEYQRRSGSAA
jgi:hypothetical protein